MSRAAQALGTAAAVVGGFVVGFLAERRLLHPHLAPAAPRLDEPPLGSIAGAMQVIEGPEGLPIAVETYGPQIASGIADGEAVAPTPQVVLVHGWMCTGRVWHEQVRGLADEAALITFDLPGHGRTPSPASGDYDLDLLSDALFAVIDQATEPGPVVLAGHSLGGMTVLHALQRHPQRLAERVSDVVLLSSTSRARPEELTFELGIHAVAQLGRGINAAVAALRGSRLVSASSRAYAATSDLTTLLVRAIAVGPRADRRVADFIEELRAASDPDMVLGLMAAVLSVDADDGLITSDARVSIGVGTHDRLTPPSLSRRMAELIDAQVIEFDQVGHMVPLEAGEEVTALLRRHLDLAADDVTRGAWPNEGTAVTTAHDGR